MLKLSGRFLANEINSGDWAEVSCLGYNLLITFPTNNSRVTFRNVVLKVDYSLFFLNHEGNFYYIAYDMSSLNQHPLCNILRYWIFFSHLPYLKSDILIKEGTSKVKNWKFNTLSRVVLYWSAREKMLQIEKVIIMIYWMTGIPYWIK